MGQCACKEAIVEVDKELVVEPPPASGASSSSETDGDKAPGCYNSSSAASTQSSSSATQLDLPLSAAHQSQRKALLMRGALQRRPSGGASSTASGGTAGIRRGDSLSTVDSFDGAGSSETSGSFKVSAEAARFGDQASAALLEASARRLANSSTTVVGSDQIVERLRNLERKIPPRPGGREGQQVRHGSAQFPHGHEHGSL